MFKFNNKEDKFYHMLSESANTVHESAKILRSSLDCLDKKEEQLKKTTALEEAGDALVLTLTKELDEVFITPIDREDIYEIVKEMDNILDCINSIMHRFIMFDITNATSEIIQASDFLLNITESLCDLMNEIRLNGCKSKNLLDKIRYISSIEYEADKLFRNAVALLFRYEKDPITIMKLKEIYQITENTIDNCEKVANIIEGVVIKNA